MLIKVANHVNEFKAKMLGSRPEVPRSKPGTKIESPIDFVHNSRPRQGKVEPRLALNSTLLYVDAMCAMMACEI